MHRRGPEMSESDRDGSELFWGNLIGLPAHAPHWLERLATAWLGGAGRRQPTRRLVGAVCPTHAAASTVARGTLRGQWRRRIWRRTFRYLAATANVMLFTRAVDPGVRLAEDGAAALIALDLRERTMAMLRIAVRKLVLPALLLVCSAVLIKSAVDVWQTWQQTEALMAQLQREKAEVRRPTHRILRGRARSARLGGWRIAKLAKLPVDQRRFDYVRLLRQVPAITELAQLDGEGREQLKVSRLVHGCGWQRS